MRAPSQRLRDIVDSIDIILQHARDLDEAGFVEAFERNPMLADTISYRFIVIGEAVNALLGEHGAESSGPIRRHPEIDWKGYAALRNILAHQYFRRSPAKIWLTIAHELPVLRRTCQRIMVSSG